MVNYSIPTSFKHIVFLVVLVMASPVVYTQTANLETTQGNPAAKVKPVNGYAEQLKAKAKPNRPETLVNQPYLPIKKPSDDGQIPEIEMFVGESRVFPSPGVGRIAVGNGSILTAAALDGKEIILFANGVGVSSLFIWNDDGRYQRVKINIILGDTSRIAREIVTFLQNIPKAKASIIGDKVIIEGDELSNQDLARIEMLAARYPQVVNFTNPMGYEQMVMVDVKVVEFPVSKLRELGLKWSATGGAAIGGIWAPISRLTQPYTINQLTGSNNAAPIVSQNESDTKVTIPSRLNFLSAINMGLNATLDALAQDGSTVVLAEPQLSARNGSSAKFLAGGEIPYAISTINGPTIQYKSYGIKLDITPNADRNGNIRAKIDTEFSQIDASLSTPGGPALLTRRTNTEFNVRNGETIVLSGLIQRDNSTSVDKVPGLGDIPIIGALFKSKRYQNKETELVIFVSPILIDAKSPGVVDRVQRTKERLSQKLGAAPYISDPLQPGSDFANLANPPALVQPNNPDGAALPNSRQAQANEPVGPSSAPATAPIGSTLTPASFDRPLGSSLRVKQDGIVLYALPDARSEVMLELGLNAIVILRENEIQYNLEGVWVPVQVGEMSGWVSQSGVEPSMLRQTVEPIVPKSQKNLNSSSDVGVAKPKSPVESRKLSLTDIGVKEVFTVLANKLPLRVLPDINAASLRNLEFGQVVRRLDMSSTGAWAAIEADGLKGWVPTQWLQPMAEVKK